MITLRFVKFEVYRSQVDPRWNYEQAMEIAFLEVALIMD